MSRGGVRDLKPNADFSKRTMTAITVPKKITYRHPPVEARTCLTDRFWWIAQSAGPFFTSHYNHHVSRDSPNPLLMYYPRGITRCNKRPKEKFDNPRKSSNSITITIHSVLNICIYDMVTRKLDVSSAIRIVMIHVGSYSDETFATVVIDLVVPLYKYMYR